MILIESFNYIIFGTVRKMKRVVAAGFGKISWKYVGQREKCMFKVCPVFPKNVTISKSIELQKLDCAIPKILVNVPHTQHLEEAQKTKFKTSFPPK